MTVSAGNIGAAERQGDLFGVFVVIAIFISCLGLFGLAAFTAGRRTREIGIRKVFGARTRDVVFLLLWQFSDAGPDRQSDRLAGGLVLSALTGCRALPIASR